MKSIKKLQELSKVRRERHHPLIHHIHKRYNISRKTLFYVKEYGSKSNATKVIIKESIKILLFASIISSFGGLALEQIKSIFLSFTPLIILMPVLNDMIGNYGTIISARFSTLLHEKKMKNVWNNEEIKKLFLQTIIISLLTLIISISAAFLISFLSGYELTKIVALKISLIGLITVISLIIIIFVIAIIAGLYFYKKKEDPNNFLIPITTSIADLGNMLVLALLVILFF